MRRASRLGIDRPVIVLVTIMSMSRRSDRRHYGLGCNALQKVEPVTLERLRSFFPRVRLQVPILRLNRIAPLNACVGVEPVKPRVLRKNRLCAFGNLLLPRHVFRNGRSDRGNLNLDRRLGEMFTA